MKLVNDSQKEWLEKGGSSEALTFIETVVSGLHTKAVNEGIIHKEVSEEVVAAEAEEVATEAESVTEEVAVETEVVTEEVAAAVVEPVAETKAAPQLDMATILTETIFAAQKQYHDSVVAPLLAEIKALKSAQVETKSQSQGLFSFDMSSLLPAAAVASRIQKEFGTTQATEVKGEPIAGTPVTKKEVAQPVDGNLLGSFLS